MDSAIFLVIVAGGFVIPAALRIRTKVHWFTAWFAGAIFLPGVMLIIEAVQPSGWVFIALLNGVLVSAAVAAFGTFIGTMIARSRPTDVAS